ncbi:MAG: hypothetical protein M3021_12160, partial [Actinomycetota bacterium]|nr:hypothetical protein [Actinomycetota bacterium]
LQNLILDSKDVEDLLNVIAGLRSVLPERRLKIHPAAPAESLVESPREIMSTGMPRRLIIGRHGR